MSLPLEKDRPVSSPPPPPPPKDSVYNPVHWQPTGRPDHTEPLSHVEGDITEAGPNLHSGSDVEFGRGNQEAEETEKGGVLAEGGEATPYSDRNLKGASLTTPSGRLLFPNSTDALPLDESQNSKPTTPVIPSKPQPWDLVAPPASNGERSADQKERSSRFTVLHSKPSYGCVLHLLLPVFKHA